MFVLDIVWIRESSLTGVPQGYIKRLLDRIKEKNPQREAAFKKAAQEAVMKVLGSFDKWQFFMGVSTDADAMICLMNFREDGLTPFMLFWKDGLIEEKVVSCCLTHVSGWSWILRTY